MWFCYNIKVMNRFAPLSSHTEDNGFTLIELLVVIGILGVLAVAVVLVLNPAELLKQGRDSTRLSDLASLTSAISLLQTDVSGLTLGSSSVAYLSLIDPAATTTAGTDCAGLGFPSPGFHCAASSTASKNDGTGWIPLNFTRFSAGSPLGRLPLDPVNDASPLFYAYFTDGTTWKVTGAPESARYTSMTQTGGFQGGSNVTLGGGFPEQWVKVPGNSAFGTSDFWVMKYEAKCAMGGTMLTTPDTGYHTLYDSQSSASYCTSANGKVVTTGIAGYPLAYVSHTTAKTYCQSIGGHLLTNDEWMTIARNAELVSSNWKNNTVGSAEPTGGLFRGNSNSSLAMDGANPLSGTNTRTWTLSNGQVIWDIAGNVWEHVQRSTMNAGDAVTAITLPPRSDLGASWNWGEYGGAGTVNNANYISSWTGDVAQAKVGSLTPSYNSTNGIGQVYTYGAGGTQGTTVFVRGADWGSGSFAGAFTLYLSWVTGSTDCYVGIRCAR